MAITRVEAADALARVEADPATLARFRSAYTGDEDAVAALREAADPSQPSPSSVARKSRLTDYERIAYGRAVTPAEEEAAAQARDEIVWEEDHRAAVAAALATALAAIEVPAEPGVPIAADSVGTEAEIPGDPRRRRRVVIPVIIIVAVVIGIAIGAIIATGAARPSAHALANAFGSHRPTAEPTPARTPVTSLVTRTYTTRQIAGWFATTSTADDTFPQPSYLTFIGLGSSTTRFIATSDKGFSLWIGKSTTGETCLVMNGTVDGQQTGSASKCLPDAAIKEGSALVINEHGLNATLTSRDLVVAVSSS